MSYNDMYTGIVMPTRQEEEAASCLSS